MFDEMLKGLWKQEREMSNGDEEEDIVDCREEMQELEGIYQEGYKVLGERSASRLMGLVSMMKDFIQVYDELHEMGEKLRRVQYKIAEACEGEC